MTKWLDFLEDARSVKAIFGDDVADLTGVTVRVVELNSDGARVRVKLDLKDFPISAPKKWINSGFNCVQIAIDFFPVSSLSVEGICTSQVGDVSISSIDGDIYFKFLGPTVIHLVSGFAAIHNISAYKNDAL